MFFGKSKNLLGLDIGSSAVKMVELKDLGKGKGYQLKAFGMEPLPAEAIVGGTIMDSGAVIDAIHTLMRDKGVKNDNVATAVDGNSVIIQYKNGIVVKALTRGRQGKGVDVTRMFAGHRIGLKQEIGIQYEVVISWVTFQEIIDLGGDRKSVV